MSFFLCVVGCLILIPVVRFVARKHGFLAIRICTILLALMIPVLGFLCHINVVPAFCALLALLFLQKFIMPGWEKKGEKSLRELVMPRRETGE